MSATIVVGRQGRVVIPAEMREALRLEPGDELRVHLSGRRLILETRDDARTALHGFAARVAPGRSLVDELIAERRAEVDANARP